MADIESVINRVKSIEERFLEAEQETGNPKFDKIEDSPVQKSENDEVETFLFSAQASVMTAAAIIKQLQKPEHKEHIVSLLGASGSEMLSQANDLLQDALLALDVPDELEAPESEEDEVEDDQDIEDKLEEPKGEPEESPEKESPKEEPESEQPEEK